MTRTSEEIARSYLDGQNAHARLDKWLKGREIDAALKAMNISAASRKPGRVGKRVGKALSGLFEAPQVVQWKKDRKVVYAPAFTHGTLGSVLRSGASAHVPDEPAIFQTDLYFRANADVTEVNASTISAISLPAMRDLVVLGDFDHETGGMAIKAALTRGRIFQTGLPEAGLAPGDVRQILIPQDDIALVSITVPIDRVEFEEEKTGHVVVVMGVMRRGDLGESEIRDLDALAHAMTLEGHPGVAAFGEMVAHRAGPVVPARFSAGSADQ